MQTTQEKQDYGKDPIAVRETDQYQNEYIENFVEKWDELINWEKREESEGDFFIDVLKRRGAKKILDVAAGTGFHSVRLLKAGFEVVSADGSPEMLARAFANARKHGQILRTVQADWRCLNRDIHEKFDAVICLGNSFTHIFEEHDRRKALAEFYAALRHDGILILDQRNYDGILDKGYSSKHSYYYCGNVKVGPEHVDEGLARFRYEFGDKSVFHLNMFPLRKAYTRKLLREVGFQTVTTYGDFQETSNDPDPDFFVHVAEKTYVPAENLRADAEYGEVTRVARDYYNSSGADSFYNTVWGGEDIHIGLYRDKGEPIADASRRTVEEMMDQVAGDINEKSRVLDLGAGYGGSARQIVRRFGCDVVCLNLSEVQNRRNRKLNKEQGLSNQIEVVDGDFENVPFPDASFDVVWSQDSLLHSGDREKVVAEAARLLKPGGVLVFTDPMQAEDARPEDLQPVLERIHLSSMGSIPFYQKAAGKYGLVEEKIIDHSKQLGNHYSHVLEELQRRHDELVEVCGKDYTSRMTKGLEHWIDASGKDLLKWGILVFRKKA